MNDHGLADLLRSLTESRRAVLGGAIAAGSGWLGAAGGDAKKKRKKCRKKPCPECPVPATCPEACSSGTCAFCLTRVGAPPLCVGNASKVCTIACSSDNDCAGTADPYCVSQFFRFSTGQTNDLCPTPGGFCTNVFPC